MSASGVLASNMVSSTAKAYIDYATAGTVTVGGALTVHAEDASGVDAQSTLLSASSASDAVDVLGLARSLLARMDDYKYTTKSGTVNLTGLITPAFTKTAAATGAQSVSVAKARRCSLARGIRRPRGLPGRCIATLVRRRRWT